MTHNDMIELVGILFLAIALVMILWAALMASTALGLFVGGLYLAVLSGAVIVAANRGGE